MRSDLHGPRFQGRFNDGKTARSEIVDVYLTERGVAIVASGTQDALIWPYGALRTAEPLHAHAIDALVNYEYQPDATLFVADGAFARQLTEHAPQLTARAERWRYATPWIWASAGVALVAAIVWLGGLSPARTIAGMLPDNARDAMGRQVVGSMTAGRRVCTTRRGRAALNKLASRLSQATGTGTKFDIVVVDWGLVNAFAAPGEQIVLTKGLITKSKNADELAGVLAHEMGHGLEMHPETGLVRAVGLTAAMELLLGGGGTLGNIGVGLAQLSYTRVAEREADGHALRILKNAGISPQGLAAFFRRMARRDGVKIGEDNNDGPSAFDLLRTHPASLERAYKLEAAEKYPATPALSRTDWLALRAICGTRPDK